MKKLFAICLLSLPILVGGIVATQPMTPAFAEGEVTETVENEGETKTSASWEQIRDTFVIPFLSSVSITSVVTLIFTIVTTVIRNKGLDKKILESENKLAECKKTLAETTVILSTLKGLYDDFKEDKKLNDENRKFVEEKCRVMIDYASKIEGVQAYVEKAVPLNKLLIEVLTSDKKDKEQLKQIAMIAKDL